MVYGRPAPSGDAIATLDGLLLPWTCLACGAPGTPGRDLCAACHADLPVLGGACPRCALPITSRGPCPRCHLAPPPHARACIPFRYAFPIDRLIVGLKFAGRLEHARLLGELLADAAVARLTGAARPAALVAVPLHPTRARERGFDQAREIARPLATRLALPVLDGAARRVRATAEQSALTAAARRANLAGAFVATGALPAHVAIVDDVVTTGATAAALAEALRAAGCARITLLAVARAV